MSTKRKAGNLTELVIYIVIVVIVLSIDSLLILLSIFKRGLFKQDVLLQKTDLGFDLILHH